MAFHQFRIIHFIILAIIALTIFLYTSYYASGPVLPQRRIHLIANHENQIRDLDIRDKQRLSITNNNNNNNKINNNNNLELIINDVNGSGRNTVSSWPTNVEEQKVSKSSPGKLDNHVPSHALPVSVEISSSPSSIAVTPSKSTKKITVPKEAEKKEASSIVESKKSKIIAGPSQTAITKNSTTLVLATNNSSVNASAQQASVDKGILTSAIYEPGFREENSNLCIDKGESLRLLILITSAPTHRDQRLAIRQTWGHYATRRDVSIGFIVGNSGNSNIEDQLQAENYMYGDLVQGHFTDSYNNLTLKTISMLEWVTEFCPNATFFLKTDDDMFINVPKLLQFIEKHHAEKRSIYGRLAKKWKPIRNKKSKYFVSPQQYFPPIFPHFTTGPAYLMTSDIIYDLYHKALEQTYLKLEDVYTTGIVAHKLNIKRIHVNEFLNRRIPFNKCNIKNAISLHMIKSNEQFDLWKKLLDNSSICK